jgi:hypothetical protein
MTALRCPRCGHREIHGTHRTFGSAEQGAGRTIEEFFCPNCELLEVADSEQASYVEVLARWREQPPQA